MNTIQVDVRSTPGAGAGLLLKIVSVVSSRGASVQSMAFAMDPTGEGHLTAELKLANTHAHTLRESLGRIIDVLDVQVAATTST